jgi:hypothetical protein
MPNDALLPSSVLDHDIERQVSQVLPIHGDNTADTADIVNALDAEIDSMWGLVACLQTILTEHSGDPYLKGRARCGSPTVILMRWGQSGAMSMASDGGRQSLAARYHFRKNFGNVVAIRASSPRPSFDGWDAAKRRTVLPITSS